MADKSNVIVRQVPRWMTETAKAGKAGLDAAQLEKRLGDLERRHASTRKFVVEVLSFAVTMAICITLMPAGPGWFTGLLTGFVSSVYVPKIIERLFLRD